MVGNASVCLLHTFQRLQNNLAMIYTFTSLFPINVWYAILLDFGLPFS